MKQIITEGRDRMLLEKWGPMLKAGDAIESDSAKLALAKVFENTYKEFLNCICTVIPKISYRLTLSHFPFSSVQ